MEVSLEQPKIKRIDGQGNPITDPLVIEELDRLEDMQAHKDFMTAKEKLRLARLLKFGDSAISKHKAPQKIKQAPKKQVVNLATKAQTTAAQLDKIIDDLFKGLNPLETLKKYKIGTRAFYSALKSPKVNKEYYLFIKDSYKERFGLDDVEIEPDSCLLILFKQARESFAESCLSQVLKLGEQLQAGFIDAGTYSALTYNLRWIMAKLFPAAYAEKIAVAQDVRTTAKAEIDVDKIKELAVLLD